MGWFITDCLRRESRRSEEPSQEWLCHGKILGFEKTAGLEKAALQKNRSCGRIPCQVGEANAILDHSQPVCEPGLACYV